MTETKKKRQTFKRNDNRGTFYSAAQLFLLYTRSLKSSLMNHIIMHTGAFCEILFQTLMAPFVVSYSQVGGLCDWSHKQYDWLELKTVMAKYTGGGIKEPERGA